MADARCCFNVNQNVWVGIDEISLKLRFRSEFNLSNFNSSIVAIFALLILQVSENFLIKSILLDIFRNFQQNIFSKDSRFQKSQKIS